MGLDKAKIEFLERCPRPQYCSYCGAEIKNDDDGMDGYSLGGIGEHDTFFGRCKACGRLNEVVMDPDNYDRETLGEFRKHGFMRNVKAMWEDGWKDE